MTSKLLTSCCEGSAEFASTVGSLVCVVDLIVSQALSNMSGSPVPLNTRCSSFKLSDIFSNHGDKQKEVHNRHHRQPWHVSEFQHGPMDLDGV